MGVNSSHQQKQAFRRKEFLETFGIGKSIYYEAIRSGRLRSIKIGRARLVRAEDAERWLETLAKETPPLGVAPTSNAKNIKDAALRRSPPSNSRKDKW